jgi:uncharacterized membrane protein YraQ (UPF0718 family)
MLALGMMWQVGWSLVLGFTLSGLVQAVVSKAQMQRLLGRDGVREIAIATGFGAVSSSCLERLRDPTVRVAVAQNAAMDFSMLWRDLFGGFLIAGALGVFVPDGAWKALFLNGAASGVQLVGNAIVGPIIAIVSFVCSIGNVPMAAILWASGISFGGVLAFLYADLIVLPLLDIYRKYYGWKMMLYIFGVFFATMVLSAISMDLAFSALHVVPTPNPNIRHDLTTFAFNYTFYLNLAFGALALYLWRLNRTHPMNHGDHAAAVSPRVA